MFQHLNLKNNGILVETKERSTVEIFYVCYKTYSFKDILLKLGGQCPLGHHRE